MARFSSDDIRRLLSLLSDEMVAVGDRGEVYLVGGAVMCLVFGARDATADVDALFKPTQVIRRAAQLVARKAGVPANWLNDAAKGFLAEHPAFSSFLELPGLSVFAARADYLLAMKCLAMRLGEEFHDIADVQYLLRYLNVTTVQEAIEILTRYYPIELFPIKTRLVLEEILA